MTDHEKLKRAIETVRESIRIEWQEVEGRDIGAGERMDLMNHIKWCANELTLLLKKFEDHEKLGHHNA